MKATIQVSTATMRYLAGTNTGAPLLLVVKTNQIKTKGQALWRALEQEPAVSCSA